MTGLIVRIRELIEQELGVEVTGADVDLLESGLVDSLALVTLIVTLEREFACELPLDEFDIEHFRTVSAMAAFVGQQNSPSSLVR